MGFSTTRNIFIALISNTLQGKFKGEIRFWTLDAYFDHKNKKTACKDKR